MGLEMTYSNINLSRHYRYFRDRALAKGCTERKAERWAYRQVKRGRRAP